MNPKKDRGMKALYYSPFLILLMLLLGCTENSNKSKQTDVNQTDNVTVEISIEGMSCMSCVANVKKTLSDVDDIFEVKVNLENKNASLKYNPQNISIDKITQTIDGIGYKAGSVKIISQ
jgi:copper chaperone CopZ